MSTQPLSGHDKKKKSRIVIDVEKMRAETRGPKRAGRRRRILSLAALVVIGVVLLALVGAYAWWRSYKKSPAYSLALLVDAARNDDLQTVEALIDGDQIAQGFVPQVIQQLTGADATLLPPQARAQVTAALPQLLPRVREGVRDEIARGVKAAAGEAGNTPFIALALGASRAFDIKETGDAATAVFKGERATELSLRRSGDIWKLVTVKDDQLANDIARRLAGSIPQGPPPQPTPPRRRSGR